MAYYRADHVALSPLHPEDGFYRADNVALSLSPLHPEDGLLP